MAVFNANRNKALATRNAIAFLHKSNTTPEAGYRREFLVEWLDDQLAHGLRGSVDIKMDTPMKLSHRVISWPY